MKSLGKTIDRILKLDPGLESMLIPIRNKLKRYPTRETIYWKELLKILNSGNFLRHPQREKIRNILSPQRKLEKPVFSFDETGSIDRILGVIPENISDKIRRYDHNCVKMAKNRVEAGMTRNSEMLEKLSRKEALMELDLKKIWIEIKDCFGIWSHSGHIFIKRKGPLLVLTELIQNQFSPDGRPPDKQHPPTPNGPGPGFFQVDPNTLRRFFDFLNLKPPPGIFPDGEES